MVMELEIVCAKCLTGLVVKMTGAQVGNGILAILVLPCEKCLAVAGDEIQDFVEEFHKP